MVMTAPGRIELRDVPAPIPQDHEVLVRTRRIGICGSDIHVYRGKHPFTSYPVIQGHEVSGEVIQTGKDVQWAKRGDRITLIPQVTCGLCPPCRRGDYHICNDLKVMGFQTEGAARELITLGENNALVLPSGMDFDTGAMIEPLAVAVHALRQGGDLSGANVLVTGAGPIGNLVAQVASASGAGTVAVTEVSPFRIALANRVGLHNVFDPSRSPFEKDLLECFGPEGPDVVFECSGSPGAIRDSVGLARKGGRIVVVAVFEEKVPLDLALIQDREITVCGTLMYQRADYEEAVRLAAMGAVRLKDLITHSFPFADYPGAYRAIEEYGDQCMKVMIEL